MIRDTIKQLESDIEEIRLNGTHDIRELEGYVWSIRECELELKGIIGARKNPETPESVVSL